MTEEENKALEDVADFLEKNAIRTNLSNVFTTGDQCKTVFTGVDLVTKESLVIKVGLTSSACAEVETNLAGYQEIRDLGIGDFIPPRIDLYTYQSIPILVMTHCGVDFWNKTYQMTEPVVLYQHLVSHMHSIYTRTLQKPPTPFSTSTKLKTLLCNVYLKKNTNRTPEGIKRVIEQWDPQRVLVPKVCFASYDFTAANTFVSEDRITYIDPKVGQVGTPILDLACFAGMARDAVNLPGSVAGFDLMQKYATTELADLLEISSSDAVIIFSLGRCVQLGLSAYFRQTKNPEQSEQLLYAGLNLLRTTLV